ncbi:MAG: hypothetical protein ACHQPI_10365 [Thermoanaerobaculia bacterium]
MSAAERGLVAIVTAIPEEYEAIAAVVTNPERLRVGEGDGGFLLRGRISGAQVLLLASGDGEARASASVSFLLREFPVSFLIGVGAAGALSPSLHAGEIVVATRIFSEGGEAPPPDTDLISRAAALGAKPATVVTTAKPVCSSKEKGAIAAHFTASDSSLSVADMESAAWARVAASRGVRFLILRAVSDTFEEELPEFLSSCLSPEGSVDRAAVARRLALHPGSLPVLLRMRGRVRDGASALGLFLERLLPEMI